MCKTLKEIIEAGKYIRCHTREDAKLLLKWAHSNGLTWKDGTSFEIGPHWDMHKDFTMYNLKAGFISRWDGNIDQSDILEFNLVAAEVGDYLKLLQTDPMLRLHNKPQPAPTPAHKYSPVPKTQPECYDHPVAGLFIQVKLHVEGEGVRSILMPVMPVVGDFVQLGDKRLCKIHTRVLGISALELYGRVVENNDGGS